MNNLILSVNKTSSLRVYLAQNKLFYSNTYGARPTVHLKSTVKILLGSGTELNPYVVGL